LGYSGFSGKNTFFFPKKPAMDYNFYRTMQDEGMGGC